MHSDTVLDTLTNYLTAYICVQATFFITQTT